MNKPISKHALRRAMEKVQAEGFLKWDEPTGTVVDRIWHELGKRSYNSGRKKATSRETVRKSSVPEVLES